MASSYRPALASARPWVKLAAPGLLIGVVAGHEMAYRGESGAAAASVRMRSMRGAERGTSLGSVHDISRITISFCADGLEPWRYLEAKARLIRGLSCSLSVEDARSRCGIRA